MQEGIGFMLAWILVILIVIHIDIRAMDQHIQNSFENCVIKGDQK